MNFFYTDHRPEQIAADHCKVHRNKMITEHCQILSAVKREYLGVKQKMYVKRYKRVTLPNGKKATKLVLKKMDWWLIGSDTVVEKFGMRIVTDYKIYAMSHRNHPTVVWAGKSVFHYSMIVYVTSIMINAYQAETGKIHKCRDVLKKNELYKNPQAMPLIKFEAPPAVVPEQFKPKKNTRKAVIEAYRQAQIYKFNEWQLKPIPIKVEFEKIPSWVIGKI